METFADFSSSVDLVRTICGTLRNVVQEKDKRFKRAIGYLAGLSEKMGGLSPKIGRILGIEMPHTLARPVL